MRRNRRKKPKSLLVSPNPPPPVLSESGTAASKAIDTIVNTKPRPSLRPTVLSPYEAMVLSTIRVARTTISIPSPSRSGRFARWFTRDKKREIDLTQNIVNIIWGWAVENWSLVVIAVSIIGATLIAILIGLLTIYAKYTIAVLALFNLLLSGGFLFYRAGVRNLNSILQRTSLDVINRAIRLDQQWSVNPFQNFVEFKFERSALRKQPNGIDVLTFSYSVSNTFLTSRVIELKSWEVNFYTAGIVLQTREKRRFFEVPKRMANRPFEITIAVNIESVDSATLRNLGGRGTRVPVLITAEFATLVDLTGIVKETVHSKQLPGDTVLE